MIQRSINEKREQIHNEIRKREKYEFFLQSRMKLLQSYKQLSAITNPVELLRDKINVKQAFEDINRRINGSSYFADTMKLIQNGLINVLFNNLREKVDLNETIETISFILCKDKLKFFQIFFDHGLIEHLFIFIKVPNLSKLCSYIICKYADKNDDYCQLILHNNKHHILMEELINRSNLLDEIEQQKPQSEMMTCKYILSSLQNCICIKESNLDCQLQIIQICQFAIFLVQKRVMVRHSLGLVFESINKLGVQYFQNKVCLLNELMNEASMDSPYLNNLFAVIFLLIPVEINYELFFKLGGMVKKMQKLLLRIMEKMIQTDKRYKQKMPTDQMWWSYLITNPSNSQNYYRMLFIVNSLQIKKEWVWRFYSAALDESNTGKVQQEALIIIKKRIRDRDRKQNILDFLHKHQIPRQLQKLQASKNMIIREKSGELLDEILGPLTEESEHHDL